MLNTKIVCTIGPATDSVEALRALMLAGMDVARLNMSHGTHEDHASVLAKVRAVAQELGKPVGVLVDLQGPKLRVGKLPAEGVVLQPVMWETHSTPAMGDRPQGLINNQVVRGCDMLIGAFWTRIGSHTGLEESGTIEEIKWFLNNKKPVMLYFSKSPIDPYSVDLEQMKKLKDQSYLRVTEPGQLLLG